MTAQEARERTLKAREDVNKRYIDLIEAQIEKATAVGKSIASFDCSGVPDEVIQKLKVDGFKIDQVFDRNEEVLTISWPLTDDQYGH
jgi:hypothetical protein